MRLVLCLLFAANCVVLSSRGQSAFKTPVLVIGGGTGGVAAAIQSARSGVKTLLVEPTHMLGGMLTAAGVSCTDGNDSLPSGIWNEFRTALHAHYHTNNLATGWVSETCFEPHVGDSIFKAWAAREPNLTVMYGCQLVSVQKTGRRVTGAAFTDSLGKKVDVSARITIDATELGDAFAKAGAGYDLGTEDPEYSKESMAPGKTDIIQDLTWAAVLKDYGPGADKTIARPAHYNAKEYWCCCTSAPCQGTAYKTDAQSMLAYGRLPNNKYMVNWPAHGNDSYLNVAEQSIAVRDQRYKEAREHTLGFIYFIQTTLGFSQFGPATDELNEGLALIPYNREGRRVHGLVRLNVNHLSDPYGQPQKLYRTGVAVGDYPVDHHHGQNPKTPDINFPKIPSFSIPGGALIPADLEALIVCEKGISVSNIVNGASRLQPVVLLTGQAAGMLAAAAVLQNKQPREIDCRSVQEELLKVNCYLMPYVDVPSADPHWASIQRVGLTGILRGTGKPAGWANKTYFYPDGPVTREFLTGLQSFDASTYFLLEDSVLTISDAFSVLSTYFPVHNGQDSLSAADEDPEEIWSQVQLNNYNETRPIKRWELAVLLDRYYNVFHRKLPDWEGRWKN